MKTEHLLLLGDALEQLKTLDDNSIDSLVTDPPAGISFMGSGSTGVAAREAGFHFIGIEKQLEYFQISKK
jgi:DNA modification methylase